MTYDVGLAQIRATRSTSEFELGPLCASAPDIDSWQGASALEPPSKAPWTPRGLRVRRILPGLKVSMWRRGLRGGLHAPYKEGAERRQIPTPTLGDAVRAASVCSQIAAALEGRGSLGAAHASELRKYVPEVRQYPRGWGFPWGIDSPGNRPLDIAGLRRAAAWIRGRLTSHAQPPDYNRPRPVKLGTNKGYPFFGSDLEAHLIAMQMSLDVRDGGVGGLESVVRRADAVLGEWCDPLGLNNLPPMLLLSRTGPLRKPATVAAATQGTIHPIGDVRYRFCRIRQVRAVSTFYNEAVRNVVLAWTDSLKSDPVLGAFTKHGAEHLTLAKLRNWRSRGATHIFSDDFANFDDSLTPELMDIAIDCFPDPPAPYQHAKDLLRAGHRFGLLSSPVHGDDDAYVYERSTGLASGTIATTLLGTTCNLLLLLNQLRAGAGVSWDTLLGALESGAAGVLIQGDDTLVAVPWAIDREKYLQVTKDQGFTRTPEDFPIFLKKWYDVEEGRAHGLAGRALMRSLTYERPPPGPFTALYGAAVRWEACAGDPFLHPCLNAALRFGPFSDFGIRSFRDLLTTARSPRVVEAMAAEVRSAPQGGDYISRFVMELGHAAGLDIGVDGALSDTSDGGDEFGDTSVLSPLAALLVRRFGTLASAKVSDTKTLLDGLASLPRWEKGLATYHAARSREDRVIAQREGAQDEG